ncbi:gametocyte-specific factor 1 homolog [Uranotaenia lowii]|uniref:gametocyte-specific factor 1 homolog n=1 Tax=Uranotaenia lowii TaxID=190385 RepID=UPI002479AA96|nr:gametocyte-specific factor 1 homolog [Uranotaenia lowii]
MSTPLGYTELVQCPYEKAHRIQPHAMSKHLFKCRKNHPKLDYVSCPFNESHRVPAQELKLHSKDCPDRASIETYKYSIATTASACIPGEQSQQPKLIYNRQKPDPIHTNYRNPRPEVSDDDDGEPAAASLDDDECWDDMNLPAYNPQEYCKNAKVIRKATLKTPAEKKKFYENERLRLRDLNLND